MNKLQVKKILVIFLTILSCVRTDNGNTQGCAVNRVPISLKDCTRTTHVFDSDRNYLKSICSVHTKLSYDNAERFCFNNGMDLLVVENQAVYDETVKFTLQQWPNTEVWLDGSGIWFNGRFINNEWVVFKNLRKQPIGKGILIINEAQNNGNCTVLKRNYQIFNLKNYDCTKTYVFYCEYQNTL